MCRSILVPIDGSPTSNRGLEVAIGLASEQKAKICLLHVVDELVVVGGADGMSFVPASYIDEFIGALRAGGQGFSPEPRRRRASMASKSRPCCWKPSVGGSPIKLSSKRRKWRADVIMLGTHGRRGLSRVVMGSDAELVLRETPVPVLLVRSPLRPRKGQARSR